MVLRLRTIDSVVEKSAVVVGKSDGSSVLRSYEDFGGGESVVGVSEGMHGGSSSVDEGVGFANSTTLVLLDILEVNLCSVLVAVVVVVVVVVMVMVMSSSQSGLFCVAVHATWLFSCMYTRV